MAHNISGWQGRDLITNVLPEGMDYSRYIIFGNILFDVSFLMRLYAVT
jgi:hypothetical protein